MLNEKEKKMIKAEIDNKESKFSEKIKEFYNAFNLLFYFILKNPLDSVWWECISLTIQYFQMLIFIVDKAVSITFIII